MKIDLHADESFSRQLMAHYDKGVSLGWDASQMAEAAMQEAMQFIPKDLSPIVYRQMRQSLLDSYQHHIDLNGGA